MEYEFSQAVNALNRNFAETEIFFNSTSILMDSNPIRSALDICDKLLAQHIFTVVASHPNSTDNSPVSVSYTCSYYNIPVVGISARDSAFSDVVSSVSCCVWSLMFKLNCDTFICYLDQWFPACGLWATNDPQGIIRWSTAVLSVRYYV